MLETAQFQWFYLGEDTGDTVADRIVKGFENRPRRVNAGETLTAYTPVSEPRRETVKMQVNQAKLVMGFRLPAAEPDGKAVMTARMLSALWGGSPQSLLFRQVREKMGLCYYCQTGYDRLKGVMTVDSGVDVANVKLAETAILEQLDRIKKGDFSDETFEDIRRSLINSYKDAENLQSSLIRWYLGQTMHPPFYSPKTCIDRVQDVTREAVIRLAKQVSFDSVYTILPEEGAE
jgi:predicted Zn-dependent peptidase